MVAATDLKFYKSTASGSLGGAITGTQILPGTPNNMFGNASRTNQVSGFNHYNCMYVKNTHTSETMENFKFWLSSDTPESDTIVKWAFDTTSTAQTIANLNTAPTGVTWVEASNKPTAPNISTGKLAPGGAWPIWVWWHGEANSEQRNDDLATFSFSFEIPAGGGGTPGGGGDPGGGETALDDFGIRKIYATLSGGRTYNSNWHLPGTTAHQWDATGGQVPAANPDPQDSLVDLISPTTCRAIVDPSTKTLTADTNSDRNSWRYYIKDPADTAASSTWKWSESTEITVYYKAIKEYTGGSIHVHCRIMGPGEHWNAITDDNPSACSAAGHEYSYEVRASGENLFRKEEFHESVANGEGYADNITFPDRSAPSNTWIGMKLVTQKKGSNMKVEAWKDLTDGVNGGTWIKAGSITDDGTNWKISAAAGISNYAALPAGSGNCTKISPIDAPLTMDGSAVGIRVDNTKVQFKKFSVREIDPNDQGSGGSGGGTGGGGPGGGTGGNPPPTPTDYKIAIVGDEGCETKTDSVINLMKGYDFIVSVGDHAYGSPSCWTGKFSSLKSKMLSAFGNHEYDDGVNAYKTFFGYNKTYFTKKFQNILFIVVDTNISLGSGSAQFDFVTQALINSHNDSTIKWKIAVMHHPWFGSSSSHSYNEFNQVQAYHSLFMQHKVDFVVTGHNHNWQRTHQVSYNAGSPETPNIVDSTPPFVSSTSALIHVVTGTGGHDSGGGLYSLKTTPAFNAYQNRTHNGIWEIVASGNGLTWTCSFVEEGGDKFDSFVITSS